jgi:hypothetical protein
MQIRILIHFIFSCLYFFLPAYFANMTPPIAKRLGVLKSLSKPIDFDKKFFKEANFWFSQNLEGSDLGIFCWVFNCANSMASL